MVKNNMPRKIDCRLKKNKGSSKCKKSSGKLSVKRAEKFKPASFMKKASGTKNWYSFKGNRKDFTKMCDRSGPQRNIIIGEDLGSFKGKKSLRHIFGIGKSSKVVTGNSKKQTLEKSRKIINSYIKKHDKC